MGQASDIVGWRAWWIAALLLAAFLAVYAPAVGHGFIKDDFEWLAHSRVSSPSGLRAVFTRAPSGFFRPVVSLSFAANLAACGTASRCYGLTNMFLAAGCAVAVFLLARGLSLSAGAAIVAAEIWAFNWHGVHVALLWISGRTALLVTLCATLAAAALVRRRVVLASVLTAAAMFSKEEAVLLPVIFAAWIGWDSRIGGEWRRADRVSLAIGSAVALAAYLVLRAQSGAFTPASAPPFYQFSLAPQTLAVNGVEYLDRSATFAFVVFLVWMVMARPGRLTSATRESALGFGALWWMGTLALTVFLPVRSSLYACLPSVGTALIAAGLVDAAAAHVATARRLRAAAAVALVPVVLLPVYATRNGPLRREAELSTMTLEALTQVARERGGGVTVVVHDDRSSNEPLVNPFGAFLPDAARLLVSPAMTVRLDPPPNGDAVAGRNVHERADVELALRNGSIVRVE